MKRNLTRRRRSKPLPSIDYCGLTIKLTPDFHFYIDRLKTGDNDDDLRWPSVDLAKAKIDKVLAARRQSKRAKTDMAVIDEYSKPLTLVGLHAGNGRFMFAKHAEPGISRRGSFSNATIYPDQPLVKELLSRFTAVAAIKDAIRITLQRYELSDDSFASAVKGGRYAEAAARLEQMYDSRATAAMKAGKLGPMAAVDALCATARQHAGKRNRR